MEFNRTTSIWQLSLLLFGLSLIVPSSADDAIETNKVPYKIYLDADQTNSKSSGKSIELGIRAALEQVNWTLGNYPVELILKDHHGSTPRSKNHLEQFLNDPNALAVFGGLHSPPLLASRDFINKNQILTLVPWAAATPITRPTTQDNWIFRLSVDDSKAGKVIIENAVTMSGYRRPFLLLENTGWGKANKNTMTKTLSELNLQASGIHFFQWGIGRHEARTILENAVSQGADSFVLVANAPEGITFAEAMLSMNKDKQKPIISHWGITGGQFFNTLGTESIQQLNLSFIQTSFSFFQQPLSGEGKKALAAAARVMNKEALYPKDITAPTGFIHAYDLTRILISAASQLTFIGDVKNDRIMLKESLETLKSNVPGLIKNYQQPFEKYSLNQINAHEALNIKDFVMARFNSKGNIILTDQTLNIINGSTHAD